MTTCSPAGAGSEGPGSGERLSSRVYVEEQMGEEGAVVKKSINVLQLVFVPEMKVKTCCYFEISF